MTAGARLVSAPEAFDAAEHAIALIGCNLACRASSTACSICWGPASTEAGMCCWFACRRPTTRARQSRWCRRNSTWRASRRPRGGPQPLPRRADGYAPPCRHLSIPLGERLRGRGHRLRAGQRLTALPGLHAADERRDAFALRLANGLQVALLFTIGFGWALVFRCLTVAFGNLGQPAGRRPRARRGGVGRMSSNLTPICISRTSRT